MKNRFTLGIILGIGIGLIISSSLGIITNRRSDNKLDPLVIKSEARKLGMLDPEDYFERKKIEMVEQKEESMMVEIEIPKGYSSDQIAQLLFEKGVIQSQNDFIELLKSKNATSRLKWGKYRISSEETLESIIDILSSSIHVTE